MNTNDTVEILSDCCGASVSGIEGAAEVGICPDCGEHCEFEEEEEVQEARVAKPGDVWQVDAYKVLVVHDTLLVRIYDTGPCKGTICECYMGADCLADTDMFPNHKYVGHFRDIFKD